MPDGVKAQWFQIMLALGGEPLHGTAVMEEVLERTRGRMRLWPGTLYGSLRDLQRQGWITEVDAPEGAPTEGGKRRFYTLTEEGRGMVADEVATIREWVRVAEQRDLLPDPG
jgi:DNA-binding PadR family transcriptional regulator